MLLAPLHSRVRSRMCLWMPVAVGATYGVPPDLLGTHGFLIAHEN